MRADREARDKALPRAAKASSYLGRWPLKLVRHTRSTAFYHNGRGNTAIGTYSPGAAPVAWKDIEAGTLPDTYSIASPPRRP